MASDSPAFLPYRKPTRPPSAIIFIHGFTGQAEKTWGEFPRLAHQAPKLADYDVYVWGCPSELKKARQIYTTAFEAANGQQAQDILKRQKNPSAAQALMALLKQNFPVKTPSALNLGETPPWPVPCVLC